MNSPKSKYLVYTSAGDHANLHLWLKNFDGKPHERNFDLWITYYGDDEGRHKDACDFYNMRKGSKFQNLLYVYNNWRHIIDHYEAVFVLDDDIIIDCFGINQLFKIREELDLWLLQPSFHPNGKISFQINKRHPKTLLRFTNFVESGCPLFRKDRLDNFMQVYDPILTGWGIDLWYMEVLQPPPDKVAVVDAITCINPYDDTKGGQREIERLEKTEASIKNWLKLKKEKGIKFDQKAINEFGAIWLKEKSHNKKRSSKNDTHPFKVAVITPYYKTRIEWLRECHKSVKAQTYPCTHFIVADGHPYDEIDSWDAQHIKLPVNISDYGDTPRGVGSVMAMSQEFDAIAYLDADNWFYAEHIKTLVDLHKKTKAAVITSARNLHRLDGSLLGKCFEVDGENFVDTSCLLLTREAFIIIPVWWSMLPQYHCIDDRVIWAHIKARKLSRKHIDKSTVAYRTAFANHYRHFGEIPPVEAKSGWDIYGVLKDISQKQQQQNAAKNKLEKE